MVYIVKLVIVVLCSSGKIAACMPSKGFEYSRTSE